MTQESYTGWYPPILFEGQSYTKWKNNVEIWSNSLNLNIEKQAVILASSLNGLAKEAAMEIDFDKLSCCKGMDTLINKLDSIFYIGNFYNLYKYFKKIESFDYKNNNCSNFLIGNFEIEYSKEKTLQLQIPDKVLAFKLLSKINLPAKDRNIVLKNIHPFTFDEMKKAIKMYFNKKSLDDKVGINDCTILDLLFVL